MALLGLASTPALALTTHVFSTSFGSPGSGDGELALVGSTTSNGGSGVAANATTHDIYVADTGNARVEEFSSTGTFIGVFGANVGGPGVNVCTAFCVAGTAGAAPGEFTKPTFVAVDNSGGPSEGDLYVGDEANHAVTKLDASGNLISSWGSGGQVNGSTATGGPFATIAGIAVDTAGNLDVLREEEPHRLFKFAQDGTFIEEFETPRGSSSRGLGVDSKGNFFKLNGEPNAEKFLSTGSDVGQVTTSTGTGLAVDSSTGDLYVDNGPNIGHYGFDVTGNVIEPGSTACAVEPHVGCAATDTFGSEHLASAAGLAVDSATHTVYAANTTAQQIAVFTGPVTLPDITEPAAFPEKHTATIGAHVDPAGGGNITGCQFQYTSDATFKIHGYTGASTIACDQATPITTPTSVTAEPSGLTTSSIYHFRLLATNAQGTAEGPDANFTTSPAVEAKIAPANPVGAFTATLNGHVDSTGGGNITNCHFEYITDAEFSLNGFTGAQSAPCTPATPITSPSSVSANITGLSPETTYHVRLVATNSDGTAETADEPFTTLPVPAVDAVAAVNLTTVEADLTASLNPKGFDTTYHFEWGTSTAYGTTTPIPDADIGSGTGDIPVTQHLTGLTPNTTYHFRVVATSTTGTTTSSDHTFIYDTTGQGLPDNRAYEMVTPPNKNGATFGVIAIAAAGGISESGNGVTTFSIQCFDKSQSCTGEREAEGEPFLFERTPAGWQTIPLAPPVNPLGVNEAVAASPDDATALFNEPGPPAGQDDWVVRQPTGTVTDLGPAIPPSHGPDEALQYLASAPPPLMTADASHVVWDANNIGIWPFDGTEHASVYEYAGPGAHPLLVGVSGGQGSTDLISKCSSGMAAKGGGTLSANGRTVYFKAELCSGGTGANAGIPVLANELYARIDNELPSAHTVAISARSAGDCTSTACTTSPTADAAFAAASADGSRVAFTSVQQLTDNASQDPEEHDWRDGGAEECGGGEVIGPNGCNLYVYDFTKPAGHQLVDASAGDTSGHGPRVQGLVALSADGTHAYFVAKGVLTTTHNTQGQGAIDGGENLYLYNVATGHTAFITTLAPSDDEDADATYGSAELWRQPSQANVTPNGQYLVFLAASKLTPDAANTKRAFEVYRYDAETGQLLRLSHGEHGFNDNGNAASGNSEIVGTFQLDNGFPAPQRTNPTMSNDGTRVFFASPAALTPHALNDVVGVPAQTLIENVYEWEQAGTGSCPPDEPTGCVYLISDGRDASTSGGFSTVRLLGSDATGNNVFFRTSDPLVPQDPDTAVDYYDARVGGGIPYTPPTPPCSEEDCKPSATVTPPDSTPGSATNNGPGNPPTPSVSPTGSPPKPLTRSQKLERAIKACAKLTRRKRAACRARAHKAYRATKVASKPAKRAAAR